MATVIQGGPDLRQQALQGGVASGVQNFFAARKEKEQQNKFLQAFKLINEATSYEDAVGKMSVIDPQILTNPKALEMISQQIDRKFPAQEAVQVNKGGVVETIAQRKGDVLTTAEVGPGARLESDVAAERTGSAQILQQELARKGIELEERRTRADEVRAQASLERSRKGSVTKPTDKQLELQMLTQVLGISPERAVKMAFDYEKIDVIPETGEARITDQVTGNTLIVPQEVLQEGETPSPADGEGLYTAAAAGTGPFSGARAILAPAGSYAGVFDVEKTVEARQQLKLSVKRFERAVANNPRYASTELKQIGKDFALGPKLWDHPKQLQKRMVAAHKELSIWLAQSEAESANTRLAPKTRAEAREMASNIRNFLAELSIPEEALADPTTQEAVPQQRWTRGMVQSAADLAGDFNTGLFSLLGPTVQDALAEINIGRRSNEAPRMGIPGRGMEFMGEAAGLTLAAAGGVAPTAVRMGTALTAREVATLTSREAGIKGSAARILNDMLNTARTNPHLFLAGEAGGAFGSGAVGEATQQAGGGDVATQMAQLGGGIAGGAPVIAANTTRQAMNWSLMHLAPWLEKSGKLVAARRVQKLAADPGQAARNILGNQREGLSPARASGDSNLLALERRIIDDDPNMAAEFAANIDHVRKIAQQNLRNEVGEIRPPGEWERSVFQSVAVPGTEIKPAATAKMLKQARESFVPLYEEFSGFPIRPQLELTPGGDGVPLVNAFKSGLQDSTVVASIQERQAATKFLKDELSRLKTRTDEGTVDSSVFMQVRENIRRRISELTAAPNQANHITARLLSNAEVVLTQALDQQLPAGAKALMRQIDGQRKLLTVVEQAVYTAGERPLSSQMLGDAVRKMMPRNEGIELRRATRAGSDVTKAIGNPTFARSLVRGQPPTEKASIQNEFLSSLWDRSLTTDVAFDGGQRLSGKRFLASITRNKETLKELGIDNGRIARMTKIARELEDIEKKPPDALRNIVEEGPASIMQLFATLVGAKSGQRVAGEGVGSSLVLAQFFANRMRRTLQFVFRDKAEELLIQAQRDPELYAALLTRPTDSVAKQDKAAQILNVWLYPAAETED